MQLVAALNQLYQPLSDALLPLVRGTQRRYLLQNGVHETQRLLAGVNTHFYAYSDRAPAERSTPVLLIHGIADNALTWGLVLRSLGVIGPVYALDLPGFGLSGYPAGQRYASFAQHKAVIEAMIEEVIGAPPLIVGNSLGGWLSARMVIERPAIAAGLVMIDPGGAYLNGRESWEAFMSAALVPDLRSVRSIYKQMFGYRPMLLYLAQHSFRQTFARDAVRLFMFNSTEEDFLLPADLQRLTLPLGLVWGLADRFLPAGSLAFFRNALPTANLLLLPGCGHLPQIERPLHVIRYLRTFARALTEPRQPPTSLRSTPSEKW